MKSSMKTNIKGFKDTSDQYFADTEAVVLSYLDQTDSWAWLAHGLDIAGLSGSDSVKVIVTRVSDSATAECTLADSVIPASDCEYSTIDELKYDYLCAMSVIKFKGATIEDCPAEYRPSTYYGCSLA